MSSILIVDDEAGVRASLGGVLRDEGYTVDAVDSGEACLEQVTRQAYDVILLDIWLPGIDGLATLERLRERRVDAQVIMISGHAQHRVGGARDEARRVRLHREAAVAREDRARGAQRAAAAPARGREPRAARARRSAARASSATATSMVRLREQIAMAAPTNGRVLISGENGTGKELVARQIHALSHRRAGPFVEVNCAAIPEELIESELFGHAKGAFTGAVADRRGKFETATGGTLFLDEVGDMSLKTQAKVLRALQEQVVEPVGGQSSVRVDVRVIAATNKDLAEEIRQRPVPRGSVLPAERDSDLRAAAARARRRRDAAGRALRRGVRARVRPAAEAVLAGRGRRCCAAYRWPGNVRELRNVIERLMIMVPGDVDRRGRSVVSRRRRAPAAAGAPADVVGRSIDARDAWERDYILGALAAFDGNISRTADALGLERSNLYKKMRGLGIAPGQEDEDEDVADR